MIINLMQVLKMPSLSRPLNRLTSPQSLTPSYYFTPNHTQPIVWHRARSHSYKSDWSMWDCEWPS